MNTLTKKLILEILTFLDTRKFNDGDIYVKKACNKLENEIVLDRLLDLSTLIDPVRHNKDRGLGKYVYYDDEFMSEDVIQNIYNEFVLLFKYLPELKEIFILKERHIEFNSNLSKSDIQEIYQFVLDYYEANPRKFNHIFKKPYEK